MHVLVHQLVAVSCPHAHRDIVHVSRWRFALACVRKRVRVMILMGADLVFTPAPTAPLTENSTHASLTPFHERLERAMGEAEAFEHALEVDRYETG